jgi:hypothetical protein
MAQAWEYINLEEGLRRLTSTSRGAYWVGIGVIGGYIPSIPNTPEAGQILRIVSNRNNCAIGRKTRVQKRLEQRAQSELAC